VERQLLELVLLLLVLIPEPVLMVWVGWRVASGFFEVSSLVTSVTIVLTLATSSSCLVCVIVLAW